MKRTVWDQRALQDPHGQADKGRRVQAMFNAIARTYELVNHVASLGRDAHWRRRTVTAAALQPGDCVLDVACGTGDLTRALAKARGNPAAVVGLDFAEQMLAQAALRSFGPLRWCRGDAMHLPFADATFDLVTCSYGVRNFQALDRGLMEFHRVLKPDGRAVILEFTMPRHWPMSWMYRLYLNRILPWVGGRLSRDHSGAYRYFPRSVIEFHDERTLVGMLEDAGFVGAEAQSLSMGIVSIYTAYKQA
jgi:demethylmenaquinone methyltransferase/2-methoxy-6-polyprenyl-1,4-benzoquinol methylase